MKRLPRIIVIGLTIASFSAFVAVVVLSLGSVTYRHTFRWVAASGKGYRMGTVPRGVSMEFVKNFHNFSDFFPTLWRTTPYGWSARTERWGSQQKFELPVVGSGYVDPNVTITVVDAPLAHQFAGFGWELEEEQRQFPLLTLKLYAATSVDTAGATRAAEPKPGSWRVVLPTWFLALAAGALPVMRLRAWMGRSGRMRRNQCMGCGYDLRGSRERCPECGEVFGEDAGFDAAGKPAG